MTRETETPTTDQDQRLLDNRTTRQFRCEAKHFCPTAFCHFWRSHGDHGKVVYGINSQHSLDHGEWLSFGEPTAKEAWRVALEKLESTPSQDTRRTVALGYEVNDRGEVFSYWRQRGLGSCGGAKTILCKRARKLKPRLVGGGYYAVVLHGGEKPQRALVHRLVLEGFVGPCPDGMQACHNNGIRTDTRR